MFEDALGMEAAGDEFSAPGAQAFFPSTKAANRSGFIFG